jgi:hypothetical protein
VETVQLTLTRSVQALSRTLLDTYAIFVSPTLSESLGLGDVGLQSVGRAAVAEAATAWVARHIDETYKRSQSMLKLVRTAQELAGVRQALWAEATVAGAWAVLELWTKEGSVAVVGCAVIRHELELGDRIS